MSRDEFTKLFNYMELKFGGIDKRFDKVEGDIRDVKFDLAELSGRVEDHHNEFLALNHQVGGLETKIDGLGTKIDNLEVRVGNLEVKVGNLEVKVDQQGKWIHQIASHTGATLSPA